MDFFQGTDVLEALFDAVLEITLRIAERELELLGPEVDVVRCGDDLGGEGGRHVRPCPGIRPFLDTTINSNSLLSQPHPHAY